MKKPDSALSPEGKPQDPGSTFAYGTIKSCLFITYAEYIDENLRGLRVTYMHICT